MPQTRPRNTEIAPRSIQRAGPDWFDPDRPGSTLTGHPIGSTATGSTPPGSTPTAPRTPQTRPRNTEIAPRSTQRAGPDRFDPDRPGSTLTGTSPDRFDCDWFDPARFDPDRSQDKN